MKDKVAEFIAKHNRIVIAQADNPDGDSLASALALEQILHEMGKEPLLYCGVVMPRHLGHLPGWDRVSNELPKNLDASIIVDTSADSLFETSDKSGQKPWLAAKPCLVIDHHDVEASIPFATIIWNKPAVATGEVIYELAQDLKWPLNNVARDMIAASIMSDSLGLTSEAVTARSVEIVAELVASGVSLAKLENNRRAYSKKTPEILNYKAELIKRIEYYGDGRLATVTIPWREIEKYSHEYNPSVLVLDEMRSVEGVEAAIAFKTYPDGKITAKIRCNFGRGIAKDLAEEFGGGGHIFAAGFKVTDGRTFEGIKRACIEKATALLDNLNKSLKQ